ncbi:MAG TPA: GFA family protein, partial [Kiloniellales bacterium]
MAEQAHDGGCLCGAVRYRVSGPSVWRAVCTCESCTRAAGAPLVAWAGFPSARFEVLAGEVAIYESTPGVRRGFCGRCGTTLTYQKDPQVLPGFADDVYIATRTLDDP